MSANNSAEQEFLAEIQAIPKFGDGLGLLRVQKALALLVPTYPTFSFTPIVVTGSNGKGSTSHYIERLLRTADCRSALFTSPHFLYFNERFRVNGERVDYQELLLTWRLLQKHIQAVEAELGQHFGRFEVLFLLAVSTFEQYQVQVAVFEAGIGGRYDPTRLLQAPYCVLTSIDIEHRALLGDTHSLICYDKLDACPTGASSFISSTVSESLLPQIYAYNALRHIKTVEVDKRWLVQLKTITDDNPDVEHSNAQTIITVQQCIELNSEFQDCVSVECEQLLINPVPQAANIATAIAVTSAYLTDHKNTTLDMSNWLAHGLTQLPVAGRMQFIQQFPFPILIDSAHTPESFQHLFPALKASYSNQSLVLIIGQSEDKPVEPLSAGIKQLQETVDCQVITTQPACRGKSAAILSSELQRASPSCLTTENVSQACQLAISLACERKADAQLCTIVVLGGLFLAAEAQVEFQQLDVELLFE